MDACLGLLCRIAQLLCLQRGQLPFRRWLTVASLGFAPKL